MIIMFASQKGGCGKSTTAVNLCAYLAQEGKDVMLVDSDRQATASNWVLDREEKKHLPSVKSIQKYENIHSTLIDLKTRYEYVIVDSPGRDSKEMRTGMTAADLLVVPFRCAQPDLDTLPKMQEIIDQAKSFNPIMSVFSILTMAPTNPVVKEIQESQKYAFEYKELPLLNSIIFDRKVYRDSMSGGVGVVELDNKKAKEEITNFAKELLNA
jgi:chromosome partitioning protein